MFNLLMIACYKIDKMHLVYYYSVIIEHVQNEYSLSFYPNDIKWVVKVLEKCTKNLIGHSRLAFNNHESNIDC